MNSPLKTGHQAANGAIRTTRHIAWLVSWHSHTANAARPAPPDPAHAGTRTQQPAAASTAQARAR